MLDFLTGESKEQREARKQRQQKINQLKNHIKARYAEFGEAIEAYQQSRAGKWEYLEVSNKDIKQWGGLNNLGSRGWELVGISTYEEGYQSKTVYTLYIFKRRTYDVPAEISEQFKDISQFKAELNRLEKQAQ